MVVSVYRIAGALDEVDYEWSWALTVLFSVVIKLSQPRSIID